MVNTRENASHSKPVMSTPDQISQQLTTIAAKLKAMDALVANVVALKSQNSQNQRGKSKVLLEEGKVDSTWRYPETYRHSYTKMEFLKYEGGDPREMRKYELNKLCMDETDPMINVEVRCKYDILLQMQTSWSDRNPGRRFWTCPHYEAMNCNYFRWRDLKRVDERSKFILLRLVNKINELEKNYDRVKMQLNKLESLKTQRHNPINMNLDDLESKQENDFEKMQTKVQSLNIKTSHSKMKNEVNENVMGNLKGNGKCDLEDENEDGKKKKRAYNFTKKFLYRMIICVGVVVSFVMQFGNMKNSLIKLPYSLEGLKLMSPDTTADFITCLGPVDAILLLGSLGYEKKFGGVAKLAPTDETSSECVALPLEFDGVVKSAPTDGTSSVFIDLPLEFDCVAKSVPTDGTGAFLGLPLSLFTAGSSSVFVCF
ncbi:hypothetical protein BC332_07772 [Capsicum chinense]|nr:hypothetical protein BC332_07772 [Capsicum chinense]